ncbi:MAG TPA: DUF6152 family protein [Steroidobacteraceae bacterium]|nr:DUF6152 family protein [Steroidobacteraceae bacterium]
MSRMRGGLAAAILTLALAAPALAHHSFAMFDRTKQVPLAGTVLEFQWTNPHVWIQVAIPDGRGGYQEWGVECTSVNMLKRQGWHHDSLKRGDRVKLMLYPLRDGSHGGQLARVVEVNGAQSDLPGYH